MTPQTNAPKQTETTTMNAITKHTRKFTFYLTAWLYVFHHQDQIHSWKIERTGKNEHTLTWTELVKHQSF